MSTESPLSRVIKQQAALFSGESLRAQKVDSFDVSRTKELVELAEGRTAIGLDFGGTSAKRDTYTLRSGRLRLIGSEELRAPNGEGYLEFLINAHKKALESGLPIGVSIAAPMEGTRFKHGSNLGQLERDLRSRFNGDFANVLEGVPFWVNNDAVAGGAAAGFNVGQGNPAITKDIFGILGSGLGALADNHAIEPGHIEVIPALNPLGQDIKCGVNGVYICTEGVAGGLGIENMMLKTIGVQMSGLEINRRLEDGDHLAHMAYMNSALVMASCIEGINQVFNIFSENQDAAIVLHGGVTKVGGWKRHFERMINGYYREVFGNDRYQVPIFYTEDFPNNLCSEGAAIEALRQQLLRSQN